MPDEIRHFIVTVPAGTPQAAPVTADISAPVRELVSVGWRLPPGCAGLVGFYLAMGGVQVQPLPAGTFVIGDGLSGTWQLARQPDSGAWEIVAYNTGLHQHQIHVTLHLDLVDAREHPTDLLDALALSNYTTQLG